MSSPRNESRSPVTIGVLLAGGRGRRMGLDKRTLEMGGETLIRVLRAMNPTLKIVVMSGRSVDFPKSTLETLGVTEVLTKPFSIPNLVAIVSRQLAG